MAAPVLQLKRGLLANLPGLRAGEPGFTTDSYDLYVGVDGTTPNNKFFGSHRYWKKEGTSTGSGINLVEGTSNGSSFITLKSPDSLSGIGTLIFPDQGGSVGEALKIVSISGNEYTLEWGTVASAPGKVTTYDESVQVGTASSTGAYDFVGAGVTVVWSSDAVGIATIRVYQASATQEGTAKFDSTNFNVSSGNVTINQVALTSLDIDGGTDIGALIADGDLVIIDDGGAGTNRKANVVGLTTYTFSKVSGDITIAANGAATIAANSVDLGTDTTGNYVATVAGTTNEIEVTGSGSETAAVTIGLPNDVVITTSLDVPTLDVATIRHTNNTQAATIDTSGNITASQNLTVSGDLYVNGSTTQVNTNTLTVEDRTIELGMINGSAPGSATTWDLGVLFNYNSSGAKKSAVVWEHADARFKFASQVSDGGGTDNDSPQITFTAYAPIEISELWVNDTAGQSQVIRYNGTDRVLENILIDGGVWV
jgi:hypothetical protein